MLLDFLLILSLVFGMGCFLVGLWYTLVNLIKKKSIRRPITGLVIGITLITVARMLAERLFMY